MTVDEFHALPTVMSYFPLTFVVGKQQWTSFAVHCNDCNRLIPEDSTRGHVSKAYNGGYRSVKVDYEVVAHGLCPTCERMTTAEYTLHDDMTFTGRNPLTGEETTWEMRADPQETPSRWKRLVARWKTMFRGTKP